MYFSIKDYAEEQKISVAKARRLLNKMEQSGKATSMICTRDNPLMYAACNYGNMPPIRERKYRILPSA